MKNTKLEIAGIVAGSCLSLALAYYFYNKNKYKNIEDRKKEEKSQEFNINSTNVENNMNAESETITKDNTSNFDHSDKPRGDESLIEWIDRQLKEAEERKKSKDENTEEINAGS